MTLIEKIKRIEAPIVSFGKNTEFAEAFADEIEARSMYNGFKLNLTKYMPGEYKIRAAFVATARENGFFIFNINWVNLKAARKGFTSYLDAENDNMITEWELSEIIKNKDYLKKTIFHNGKVEFKQNKNFKLLQWK